MSHYLTDDDRSLLDMLDRVCWSCAEVTPNMPMWEREAEYRQCQDVLESVLVNLLHTALKEVRND